MASTSGRIQSGTANFSYFYFQWQLAGQDVNGNTSTINWQWGLNTSNSAFWGSNAVKSVSGYIDGGLAFGANTWSNISVNGDHQLLSGSWIMGHNSDGTRSFGMSSTGNLYQSGNLSNSGSWDLPQIARNITISSTSGNISDEDNPYILYSNPAGHACTAWLELEDLTGSTQYAVRSNYVSGADFGLTTTERNTIRGVMTSVNSTRVRYVTYDNSTGAYSFQDFTLSIINGNPVFTTVAYHDSNSTTSTLTGNNQFIIQNTSIVNVDISSGNKAVAQKSATMVSYTASLNAVPTNFAYSSSTINQVLTTGSAGSSTNQVLQVTATDSRGNTTTVSKTVTMIPYTAPILTVSAERADGFGASTTINISGTISTITVSGTDKNAVNTTSGVGYKVWAVGGSEPGSYTNVANTTTGSTTTPNTNPVTSLDESTTFNLKVQITDKISQTIFTGLIGIGSAVLRIGTDGNIYNNNKQLVPAEDLFPVGAVLILNVNTTPTIPGTWTATTTASASLFGETLYAFKRTV